jgi:hypothetical protein
MYFEERWDQHVLAAFMGSTLRFHDAIRRLGPSDFTCEILATAATRESLNQLERQFIATYQANDPTKGYNMTTGGGGGRLEPADVVISEHKPPPQSIPLYNCYGEFVGKLRIEHALSMHGIFLTLRARGTGKRRHFTSAKLYARKSWHWEPRASDGYVVMQLLRN